MLHTHTSNHVENLVRALADVVGVPTIDVFRPETIIVQSRGMQRWISLRLAERLGIWANAEYPFPQKFLWQVFQDSLGEDPSQSSPFDWPNLEWNIMRRLPAFLKNPAFAPIRRYLSDPADLLKRFQLANRIARTFDQYVVYRPEILRHWETHREGLEPQQLDLFRNRPDQAGWQEILWRMLVEEYGPTHRAAVLQRFAKIPVDNIVAPERISIFGLSTLAPSQLEVFGHLAKKIDIHLFQLTPSSGYYADLADRRFLRRLKREGKDPEELGFDQGNALLASMGRLGGDFTHAILELPEGLLEQEHHVPPKEDTALHCLQHDLFHLNPCRAVYPDDDTIQIHAMHGCMREVEVLKNRLLDLFERDNSLKPRDILVMSPEIENYAQAIEAVFPDSDPALDLPYSLADRSPKRTNPAGEALIQLIDLLQSRFETTRVLEFLDLPVVRERFGFEESDIEQVRYWAEELRVKWGRDAEHRVDTGVPGFAESTWQQLIDRLLIGYAMGGTESKFFRGILSEPDVEGGLADILGRLSACLRLLFDTAKRGNRPLPLHEWEPLLLDLLRHPDHEPNQAGSDNQIHNLADLTGYFATLRDHHEMARFEEALPLDVLRHWLARTMDETRNSSPFLGGGITCCNLVPMRSIPFRVVCILGLNDGDFPRIQRRPGFDLTVKRKRGDRSRREDDRYLFLEAMVSARDVLYLSYHGMGIRDNATRPPSVLVSELLDALHDFKRERVVKHPLQAYSPKNFDGVTPVLQSFSREDLAAAHALRTIPVQTPNRFDTPWQDAIPHEVTVKDLVQFFESPPTWFLSRVLSCRFAKADETPDNRLTDIPNELDKYFLRNAYLEALDEGDEGTDAERREKARGRLPPGKVGHVHGLQMLRDATVFKEKLQRFKQDPQPPREIDITVNDVRITGTIDGMYAEHALSSRFGTWRPQDEFGAYVRHCLLNATDPIKSIGFGRNTKSAGWSIRAERDSRDALQKLADLIHVFKEGHTRPLPFFPATVKKYAKRRFGDKVDPDVARVVALGPWYGSPWSQSELERYPAHRFLYRDREPFDDPEFDQLANTLALWSWR